MSKSLKNSSANTERQPNSLPMELYMTSNGLITKF